MVDEMPPVLYELWDTETRNLIDAFTSREAALICVRDAMERHGRAYIGAWVLGRIDDDGLDEPLIEGATLIEAALRPIEA